MKIQNIDCRYLDLYSSAYEGAYSRDQLKSIEIRAKANHEDYVTQVITIDDLADEWNLSFDFQSGATINQVYLKNIFTNQSFLLLTEPSSYPITGGGIVSLQAAVNNSLNNTLNLVGASALFSITGSTLSCTITGLPVNIIAEKLQYEYMDITQDKFFTYLDSDDYLLNNSHIYLKPSFFDKETFTDGVYHFRTRVLTTDDLLIEEEICFFVDCVMSQNILDNVNPDICNETDVSILMLHYSLNVTSNSECDCEKMQEVFDFLEKHIDTYNNNPCGC